MVKRPLRILLVSPYAPNHLGGTEKGLRRLSLALAAAGHDVTWCTSDVALSQDIPDIRLLPMRTWNICERLLGKAFPFWSIRSLRMLKRAVRQADVVHVHEHLCIGCVLAVRWARHHNIKTVATSHSVAFDPAVRGPINAIKRRMAAAVFENADVLVAVGDAPAAVLRSAFGTSAHILPNGIDKDMFSPGAHRECGTVCLYAGRFVAEKGLPLLQTLAGHFRDRTWIFVGEGPIDPHTWNLPNVRVIPAVHDDAALAAIYRSADVLVLPSLHEGHSNVVNEALCCGLQVLLPAALCTGPVGAACTPVEGGADAWQDALESLHDTPADRERRLAIVRLHLGSWSDVAAAYEDFFSS